MNAYDFLNAYRRKSNQLRSVESEISSLRDLSFCISPKYNEIRSGSNSARQQIIDKIIDTEKQRDLLLRELLNIQTDIMRVLNTLEKPLYRDILSLRYISLLSYADISEKLYHNEQYIRNAHCAAVKEVQQLLDNKQKDKRPTD